MYYDVLSRRGFKIGKTILLKGHSTIKSSEGQNKREPLKYKLQKPLWQSGLFCWPFLIGKFVISKNFVITSKPELEFVIDPKLIIFYFLILTASQMF